MKQGQNKEALEFFEKAEKLSRSKHLNFQLAENLLYLADTLDLLGRPAGEQIQEAKRIARLHHYDYLLARAGEIQGDMSLRKQEYQGAFKHYRVACRYMAQRSSVEFNRMLRRLNDSLLEIPPSFLPGVIDLLLSYWQELALDVAYPGLPEVCREVSRHMLL
jgi:tetratricopeptide (TPR) repeat protein